MVDVPPWEEPLPAVTPLDPARRRPARRPWLAAAAAAVLVGGVATVRLAGIDGPTTVADAPASPATSASGAPGPVDLPLHEVRMPVLRYGHVPAGFSAGPWKRWPHVQGHHHMVSQQLTRPARDGQPELVLDVGVTLTPFTGNPTWDPALRSTVPQVPPRQALRPRSAHGLDWSATEQDGRVGDIVGGNDRVTIQIAGSDRPPAFTDEVLAFIEGVAIEGWAPYLDAVKQVPSDPDEVSECEHRKAVNARDDEADVPLPEGCTPG